MTEDRWEAVRSSAGRTVTMMSPDCCTLAIVVRICAVCEAQAIRRARRKATMGDEVERSRPMMSAKRG